MSQHIEAKNGVHTLTKGQREAAELAVFPEYEYVEIQDCPAVPELGYLAGRLPPICEGIATGKTGCIAGEPGTGKSMYALTMCCAIASGQPILGLQPSDPEGRNVLFLTLEEDMSEVLLRWKAICQVHSVDTKRNLHIAAQDNVNFIGTGGIASFITAGYADLRSTIKDGGFDFVVLDPLSKWRLEAEDNATHALFFGVLTRLCIECETTIFVVHHTRKPPPGTPPTFDANDLRGSSTILGEVRTLILLAKQPRIGKEAIGYKFVKCQYTRPPEMQAMEFTEEIVDCKRGSFGVGVLKEFTPTHAQPLPAHKVEEYRVVLKELFADADAYRSNVQSSEWLGFCLAQRMGVDVGIGQTSAKRSEGQAEAYESIKTDIARLMAMGLLRTEQEEMQRDNRTTRVIPVYKAGARL